MLSALAFHQCGPGSNLGVDAIIMWVEFVVGSLLCSERLFSGYSSPQKPTFINLNSTRNDKKEPLCGCATLKSLFIPVFIYVCCIYCKEWLFCGRKGTLQTLELLEIWSCLHNISVIILV